MSRFNFEAAVTQGPEYQKSRDYNRRQEFDSGFSDLSSTTTSYTSVPPGPTPPNLIVDVENGDSGITLDDAETDCVATVQHRRQQHHHHDQQQRQRRQQQRKLAPAGVAPMEVDETPKLVSRGSGSTSPVSYQRARKSAAPRLPKKTIHSSSSGATTSSTVSAPHRSASPKSVYTSELHTSTFSTSPSPAPAAAAVPYNKENQGPSSLPFMRSGSPLTCNNFQSLNLPERVPPIGQGMSSDVFQLRDYLNFFLPDTKEGDTGFHLAVIHNQPDLLDKLLYIMSKDQALKSVIDEQNCLFQTALHLATHLQQLDSMRKLLISGASIDIIDHKGNTPLHVAARFSSTRPLEEIAKYVSIQTLLEVSKVRNMEGLTCVHVAAKNGNMEILRKLQSLGLDMNIQDFNSGKTALHLAVESNSLPNVQFLLETCEAEVNSITYSGCSPLHVAAGRGEITIVAYLISMGADPDLCTDEGDIALDLAGSGEVNAFLNKVAALRWME